MPNTSASGGYLQPLATPTAPTYDIPLEDSIQAAIVGITGVPASLVRPRYQPEPADIPDFDTGWVSFGITLQKQDQFAYQQHDPLLDVAGANVVERDEWFEVFSSFYGPTCTGLLSLWCTGLALEQNRWALLDAGIKLESIGEPVHLPALLKQRWVKRVDIRTVFSRRSRRAYAVQSLQQAQLNVLTDVGTTSIIINP